ncbi:MAG: nitrate reductase [Deltaproteobacteria bacterium]|jgi:nitrate reductase gamma subunit|nr:nitrate reductase [Deltaproteobacteria bacterium]
MSLFVYLITYAGIVIFCAAVLKRIISYINNPMHVRWELYPVPHEGGGKAEYGGSYLEEVDWWKKPRETSKINELKVMAAEILGLKAVYEYNRPLWFVTYPFHIGLYFTVMFLVFLFIGSIAGLMGIEALTIMAIVKFTGPLGFILTICGAAGLLYKRLTDENLKIYSSIEHYFNLILFIVTMGVAVLTWLFVDPDFVMAKTFIAGLISFKLTGISNPLFLIQIFLIVATITYIPFTHMSHFFMKYFLYHDIRWDDKPNIDSPETNAKINVVLNYPITWSAEHIAGHGKKTWAEVATFNPEAQTEKEQ